MPSYSMPADYVPSKFVANHLRDRLLASLNDAREAASVLDLVPIEAELRRLAKLAPRPEEDWTRSSNPDQPLVAWDQMKITRSKDA